MLKTFLVLLGVLTDLRLCIIVQRGGSGFRKEGYGEVLVAYKHQDGLKWH